MDLVKILYPKSPMTTYLQILALKSRRYKKAKLILEEKSEEKQMKKLGLDIGTKNIVLCWRDENDKIKTRYEVNGYIILPQYDAFTEQLLIRNRVPYVKRGKELIAIGQKAENLAFSFNKTLRRPMAEGGVSKTDDDAQEIMAMIIKGIIGKLDSDAVIYYCTTAKAINSENLNIDFHKKIVKLIIEGYGDSKIQANHINEARCLIINEPNEAIGISWGAGTVTVHAGIFGVPIFEFSVVGAGDFVDVESAKRFGYDPLKSGNESRETPTTICRRKEQLDISKIPDDNVGQTIVLMYEILIENVVNGIIKGLNENKDKFRFDKPISIINAGGTSMPVGFINLLTKKLNEVKDQIPMLIGDIKLVPDPLFAVSHGCLAAAEAHVNVENLNTV
jgi:hypothetical protein